MKSEIFLSCFNEIFFSVAPSFFHTCVAAGKVAKMEDIERFKVGNANVLVTFSALC